MTLMGRKLAGLSPGQTTRGWGSFNPAASNARSSLTPRGSTPPLALQPSLAVEPFEVTGVRIHPDVTGGHAGGVHGGQQVRIDR